MEKINHYANGLFGQKDPYLDRVTSSLEERGIRNISVPPASGQWLTALVKMKAPKHVLEIGALGGYSGICMLKGLGKDGSLTSLELEKEYANLAEENVRAAGYGEQVSYIIGNAKDSLRELIGQGRQFEFFFIDADKESYREYLDCCIELATDGAVILMDNVLVQGLVADVEADLDALPENKRERVRIMRELNSYVSGHPKLDSALLPIGDGILCSTVSKGR